jgi:hypothetical protein
MGPLSGRFEGWPITVSYYQRPSGEPPTLGLRFIVSTRPILRDDSAVPATDEYQLQVGLWSQGPLPSAVDLATYSAVRSDGQPEPATVAVGHDGEWMRASAGTMSIEHAGTGKLALRFSQLEFSDPMSLDSMITGGVATATLDEACYVYQPHMGPPPEAPGGKTPTLIALPSDAGVWAEYVQDQGLQSSFCKASLGTAIQSHQ